MHVVSQIEGQEICILEDCSGARIKKKNMYLHAMCLPSFLFDQLNMLQSISENLLIATTTAIKIKF